MTRVVSLFLPTWPTDRYRRGLGQAAPSPAVPLVLVGRDDRRRVVLAADAPAQAAGLRVGMPVTKAQALVPSLIIKDAAPAADAAALARLAVWALRRYAPIVAADPPDGLVIEADGAAHLHGGETAMLADLIARLAASGITARAAIADSWGAAHALARYAGHPVTVMPPGTHIPAIAALPIAALRLPAALLDGLRRLGFERIGDLAAQPRAPLALRFGPEPGRRLDQAQGSRPEPIDPIRPPDLIAVRRVFAEPIGAPETIARFIGTLVVPLCAALEAQGLGARRLDLLLHRVDNHIEAIRVGTALPVRDVRRLTRLLCDRIETIDPGFGIEIISLTATLAEPLAAKQAFVALTLDPETPETGIAELIDTLANRVGEQRLYRFAPVASDVPERSVCRIAPTAPQTGAAWPDPWPRPSRLLPQPEPIETVALLPDHPPVSFTWRGIRRRVKRADGPERVFGEWWRRDAELIAVRDYFQVEDEDGERFWIYRAGDGEDAATGSHRWFLHGIFG
ncbi:MAG: DNA polymerase Y family protein [Azospirillaceae bacterium]|nr:DNA polymerase Y family protein [Azospirillaceae bacterium]